MFVVHLQAVFGQDVGQGNDLLVEAGLGCINSRCEAHHETGENDDGGQYT